MEEARRGSDELLKAYRSSGVQIDETTIEVLAGKVREIGVHDVIIKGIPKPDFVKAVFLPGDVKAATSLATEVLDELTRRNPNLATQVSILTRGIPWPEQFKVEVVLGQAAQ